MAATKNRFTPRQQEALKAWSDYSEGMTALVQKYMAERERLGMDDMPSDMTFHIGDKETAGCRWAVDIDTKWHKRS